MESIEGGMSFAPPPAKLTAAERRQDGLRLEVQDQGAARQVQVHLGNFDYPEEGKAPPKKEKGGEFTHAFIRELGTIAVVSNDEKNDLKGNNRLVACYTTADREAAKGKLVENLHLGYWTGTEWKKFKEVGPANVPEGFEGFEGAKEYKIGKPFKDPAVAWGS